MELLRTIAYPPGGGGGASKGCEAAMGRGGGESRRKKAEEQPHQHPHAAAEVSRIITDPTTGKRYCRGKVLGKVMDRAPSGQNGLPCPRGAPLGPHSHSVHLGLPLAPSTRPVPPPYHGPREPAETIRIWGCATQPLRQAMNAQPVFLPNCPVRRKSCSLTNT